MRHTGLAGFAAATPTATAATTAAATRTPSSFSVIARFDLALGPRAERQIRASAGRLIVVQNGAAFVFLAMPRCFRLNTKAENVQIGFLGPEHVVEL